MVSIPLLVGGLALVLAGGTSLAAGFGAFDQWAGDIYECSWHIDVPQAGASVGTLRMTFNNSVVPMTVRACAYDADGFQRVDETFEVPVAQAHVVELPVPTGRFLLAVEMHGPHEAWTVINAIIDSTMCQDGDVTKEFPIGQSHGSSWYGLRPATCTATGEVVEIERPDSEGSSGRG